MKNYFSHDEGARNDPKLVKVLMRLGQAGKGVYWDLVEMLYEQGGYLLLEDCESHAFALRTDCELITKLVCDFDLFATDGTRFWSNTCLERMEMRDAKKLARAEAGAKGGKIKAERDAAAKALLQQSPSNAIANAGNAIAIKRNEIKVNTTDVVPHGTTAAAPEALKAKSKGEIVSAQVAADGGETFTADTFTALNDPTTFANLMDYLGHVGIDTERYRLDIRGKVKAAALDVPATALGKYIVSYLTRELASGPLTPAPVATRPAPVMPADPCSLWGAPNPDYDHRAYSQPAGQYSGTIQ